LMHFEKWRRGCNWMERSLAALVGARFRLKGRGRAAFMGF
jgi:hypothetical protein